MKPEYDPTKDGNLYRWIVRTAKALRATQTPRRQQRLELPPWVPGGRSR